jgi:hypothetical protein
MGENAGRLKGTHHMPIITTAVANLLIILIIGIVAGLVFNRYAHTWSSRQFTRGRATPHRRWSALPERSSVFTLASYSACCRHR